MENQLDKIIAFAKEKKQTDVNSHRGAYQTIINYCQALRIHCVVGRSEQLLAFLEWVDQSPEENANRSREDLVKDYLSQ